MCDMMREDQTGSEPESIIDRCGDKAHAGLPRSRMFNINFPN